MGAIGHDSVTALALARRRKELAERIEVSLELAEDAERAAEQMRQELNQKLQEADKHREAAKGVQEQVEEIEGAYKKLVGAAMPGAK
jgi:ribosome recycling factor